MQLLDLVLQNRELKKFIEAVPTKGRSLLTGVNPNAVSLVLELLLYQIKQPIIYVAESEARAQELTEQLAGILQDNESYTFPVDPLLATQGAFSSPDELAERILALDFLGSKRSGVVVTTAQALQYQLSQPQDFLTNKIDFQLGREYDIQQLNEWFVYAGFTKDKLVARPGEFAIRGDILDIYPLNREKPLRLEFFGDELDSIKEFDLATQRSDQSLDNFTVLPALDRVYDRQRLPEVADQIEGAIKQNQGKLDVSELDELLQNYAPTLAALREKQLPEHAQLLLQFLLPRPASILDYLSQDGLVIFDDWNNLLKDVKESDTENQTFIDDEVKGLRLAPRLQNQFEFGAVVKASKQSKIYLSLFQKGMGSLKLDQMLNLETRQVEQFFSQMPLIKAEITKYQKQKQTVVLQADSNKRALAINQTLVEFGVDVRQQQKKNEVTPGEVQIAVGSFMNGFSLPDVNLVYLTERELFNQRQKKQKRMPTLENAQRIRNYTELKPGDFVVHVNHGIGRFEGIKTLTVDGNKRDYITITYQKHDQLFVPAEQLALVQKYTASEGKLPKINKLGGSEWAKTKRSVATKIEDIADDLVDLYAKRESERGFAFSQDNEMQRQFEESFPYPETPDQLRSIAEIKADMERPRPMDRLLVGDVGFGKTEVALRAAFKAAQDGKQTAFLVPTTILAQQHYETMQERFRDFPVNIAILSRFQSKAQVKETIYKLERGLIDVVVGTHRILSKDVKFKDLGLLIVDEEQRFGVKHKERLKELKAQVDVLTLTATPIPRTLHMSMVGVRDLSVIETPPSNRYPIQTYVTEQIPSIVRETILREMARQGQVFYLHNRIDDIENVVFNLEQLVPEARIEYIHGRMNERQLEDILYRFLNQDFDVLVTTTIIETGVDMRNVNTLIVEDADHYGLSQLYQLRGRVGRSSRIAYAYFLYKQNKVLTEVGEKRLTAIKDFTELGSGFKIAMRDLSIRGAGNLLGKQQHGFIDSVGYDLYAQMLDEAIKNRQGKKTAKKTNAEVEFDLEAYIPDNYIDDQRQKIEFYKKIKQVTTNEELEQIEDELIDRFGDYPSAVEHLLLVARIKLAADFAQVHNIRQNKIGINVVFTQKISKELQGENIFKALNDVKLRVKVHLNERGELEVLLITDQNKERQIFAELETFLNQTEEVIGVKNENR
ncbi:transcription-repair coupling factor [Amylolactobacillus amylotrophicus DSM 20534]|uniref:Transcription-repair-coupling factor n=3 Tax=Amylolactobacillus TaxID=2767876 RepID=A0A0R1YSR9_9LACO|nr:MULTISPECIES: transcription-repair coupling factor [Amylolactobacillus]APT18226.1 transcription-repair coupling factor [Amylolactobacillus amylophilus DSM 20533 = JCM 1125]KRK37999.1 transcription-repair coupling factor [Amylolactobacillus amylotrophicus DSM 20534]KRM42259.1 transcription-repair coupling factor [Amylolactobacillus amylophilus DSM 20533 = JCM 1125]GED80186.1 transcription-repair-coupling factor [Amylolactobacillus amylophilus]